MPDNQLYPPQSPPKAPSDFEKSWFGKALKYWTSQKPKPFSMSPYGQEISKGLPQGWSASDILGTANREARGALGALGGGMTIQPVVRYQTISEGGWDFQIGLDKDGNVVSREALGRTELPAGQAEPQAPISQYQQSQIDLQRQQMEQEQQQYQQQMAWNQSQAAGQMYNQERQYSANLMANPQSWLEYSAYAKKPPAIQPWMLPLESSAYGWQGNQAGQKIPNWNAENAQNIPQLLNPSMQYWNRISPTAQQQYLGYEQARTGARPEDTMFRQQATAPPSGYRGLRWGR